MKFEIAGVRELGRKLDLLTAPERRKVLSRAVRAGAKPVVEAARLRIPANKIEALHKTYKGRSVAPGFARRSIASKAFVSRDRRAAAAIIGVKREAFYATQFVEVGTSKQAKQEWLRPAFAATTGKQIAAVARVMREDIVKVARDKR